MNIKPHLIRQDLKYIFLFLLVEAFFTSAFAREKNEDKGKKITDKIKRVFNGFSFGAHERLFPYLSLEDWFDPYAGPEVETLRAQERKCENGSPCKVRDRA